MQCTRFSFVHGCQIIVKHNIVLIFTEINLVYDENKNNCLYGCQVLILTKKHNMQCVRNFILSMTVF